MPAKDTQPKKEKVITKQVGLNFFHDKKWFQDPTTSVVWMRIYSSVFIPWKHYHRVLKKALKSIEYDQPIKVYYGILEGLKYQDIKMSLISTEDGTPQISIHGGEQDLPKSTYIIFSTPFTIDGKQGNEIETKKRLNMLASILNMHFGNNYLRDIWVEGIVNAHDAKLHTFGAPFQLPQIIEGPAIHPLNWKHSKSILQKIANLTYEKKQIIELALTLFERGIRDKSGTKFFYYWVALEVLCQTNNADHITQKLATFYNTDKDTIKEKLYWKKFFVARHNYFHKGVSPNFSATAERYAQLLFLDLLRCELSMKNLGHLSSFINMLKKDPFQDPTKEEIEKASKSKPKNISKRRQTISRKETDKFWDAIIKERKL